MLDNFYIYIFTIDSASVTWRHRPAPCVSEVRGCPHGAAVSAVGAPPWSRDHDLRHPLLGGVAAGQHQRHRCRYINNYITVYISIIESTKFLTIFVEGIFLVKSAK